MVMNMIEKLTGGKDNPFYKLHLNWRANVFVDDPDSLE